MFLLQQLTLEQTQKIITWLATVRVSVAATGAQLQKLKFHAKLKALPRDT